MNLSIRAQLIGGFGIVVALLVAVFGVSFWGMNSMASATDRIVHVDFPADEAVRNLELLVAEQMAFYPKFTTTLDDQDIERLPHHIEQVESGTAALYAAFGNTPEIDAEIDIFRDEYRSLTEDGTLFIDSVRAGEDSQAEIVVKLREFESAEIAMLAELEALAEIAEANVSSGAEAAIASERRAVTSASVLAVLALLISAAIAFLLVRKISGGINEISVALKQVALGDVTAQVNIDSGDEIGDMSRAYGETQVYLTEVSRVLERIGDGDLTVEVSPQSANDTINNAMKKMIGNMRQLIGQVATTAKDMTGASSQLADASSQAGDATQGLADASQQVATGAQEQATNIQKASALVDDLIQNVALVAEGSDRQTSEVERVQSIVSQVAKASKRVAENAQGASEGAQTANVAASNGVEVVQKTISGMSSINDAVQNVATEVSNLGERSQEIGKIVSVIDDIAAQTNLLALNAAIEAARAGEQGRGFAVVADEVRQLAERVSRATSEIAALIESVQESVSTSVQATETGTRQVEEGTALASGAGEALDEIIKAVGSVTREVEEISALAEEVSASSSEMVGAIDGIGAITAENSGVATKMNDAGGEVRSSMEAVSAVTEETSAAAEQTSASTEQMSAQVEEVVASAQTLAEMAQSLERAVEVFKVTGPGSPGDGRSDTATADPGADQPKITTGAETEDEELAASAA